VDRFHSGRSPLGVGHHGEIEPELGGELLYVEVGFSWEVACIDENYRDVGDDLGSHVKQDGSLQPQPQRSAPRSRRRPRMWSHTLTCVPKELDMASDPLCAAHWINSSGDT
jgi:hypothetical protein